jgi:hypothetical protein
VDADNHLRLSRSQWLAADGGPTRTSYNLRGAVGGNELAHQEMLPTPDPAPVAFRVRRVGNRVSAAYRPDGKDWKNFPDLNSELPAEVKVGVYVAHNFDQPLEVVFEPLIIEKPEKKD